MGLDSAAGCEGEKAGGDPGQRAGPSRMPDGCRFPTGCPAEDARWRRCAVAEAIRGHSPAAGSTIDGADTRTPESTVRPDALFEVRDLCKSISRFSADFAARRSARSRPSTA